MHISQTPALRSYGSWDLLHGVKVWKRELQPTMPDYCRLSKSLLNNATSLTLEQALDAETVAQNYMFTLSDTREAVAAFTEKRDPKFKGY